jgi:hypothetical protein
VNSATERSATSLIEAKSSGAAKLFPAAACAASELTKRKALVVTIGGRDPDLILLAPALIAFFSVQPVCRQQSRLRPGSGPDRQE